MKEFDATKYGEMQKYTRYLRKWADEHDGSEFYGMSPAGFEEWLTMKAHGFQPEEDYIVIGGFSAYPLIGINTDDIIKIPHIHIMDRNKQDIACVGLEEPAYLQHEGEDGELDNDKKTGLEEFLSMVVDYPKFREAGITLWDYACLTWNYNNEAQIPEKAKMPDYTGTYKRGNIESMLRRYKRR